MRNNRILRKKDYENKNVAQPELFINTSTEFSECGNICAVISLKPELQAIKLLTVLSSTYGFVFNHPTKIEHAILLPIYKSIVHSELFMTVNVLKKTVSDHSCNLIHWFVTVNQ